MNNKKLLSLIFLFIAALSLIFSIVSFSMDVTHTAGGTEISETYGGDAYTGIQNAAAQGATNTYYVSKNVQELSKCIKTVAGFAFMITAFTFAGIGITNLFGDKLGAKMAPQFGNAFPPAPMPAAGFGPMDGNGFAPMPPADFAPMNGNGFAPMPPAGATPEPMENTPPTAQ